MSQEKQLTPRTAYFDALFETTTNDDLDTLWNVIDAVLESHGRLERELVGLRRDVELMAKHMELDDEEITTLHNKLEAAQSARAAIIEECAKVCDKMVIGGRAWSPEQKIAAECLFAAAAAIRALDGSSKK